MQYFCAVNYLRAEKISKHYGERSLFENLTISIERGQKAALIARNGAGKTSLLNILTGKDLPDGGTVEINKNITLAYLDQDPQFPAGITVWDALFHSNNLLLNAVANYEKLLEQSHNDHSPSVMKQLQVAMEQMDRLNAWDYETRIRQILGKLNILHLSQQVESLSGGQKKRLALAKLLILQPDFVILDEPTNHLDIGMIEWLEGYLKSSDMTLLVVTHDRYFLDQVCSKIFELSQGVLYQHHGNYAYFLEKKADREFREGREIDKARNLLRKELEWMRRQPKARGTKSKSRIEAFHRLQEKASQINHNKQVELNVKMNRLGSKIIEMHHVSKSFVQGDHTQPILQNFSYTMKPGERIGIVGNNGVGKSTFLNLVLGLTLPDEGKISRGETLVTGYYSQEGLQLKSDKRVLEVVTDIAEYIQLEKGEKLTAAQLCRHFLFDDKMQHTYVSKLSGGEKRRLFLLTILMKNPNLLILDEPTNDLDIDTLNVLEDFLETYRGCILMVSHDRYFMDRLVDHLLIFEGNGIIRDFNGNYQDYVSEKGMEKEAERHIRKPVEAETLTPTQKPKSSKPTFKEQTEYKELTREIALLTDEKSNLENELSGGLLSYEAVATKAARLEEVNAMLDSKEFRWLELDEKIKA